MYTLDKKNDFSMYINTSYIYTWTEINSQAQVTHISACEIKIKFFLGLLQNVIIVLVRELMNT